MAQYGLIALTAAFVLICGINDGGALVAMAVRQSMLPGYGVLGILVAALLAGPTLFGLAVAGAFTQRLVETGPGQGQALVLGGISVAIVVVLGLAWRGIGTSVTLAVIGGLAGAGLGLRLTPSWSTLAAVLAVGALTPFAGGALAFVLGRLAGRMPTWSRMPAAVRLGHLAAFTGLSLAYAANDGQKVFAVIAVASGAGAPSWPLLAAAVAVFAAGAVVSLRRMMRGASARLLTPQPWHLVSAQAATSVTVFAAAGGGIPVSMTQSAAAGLVGAGASHGARRVRWQHTLPVVTSWLATLPLSFGLGIVAGLLIERVS